MNRSTMLGTCSRIMLILPNSILPLPLPSPAIKSTSTSHFPSPTPAQPDISPSGYTTAFWTISLIGLCFDSLIEQSWFGRRI